ncbi:non-ribosomal peptide synthetase [Pigmentiphaga litoralis]|uniref:non-ribosomal peptide synthetase n=1 Tax=Pigmentiphaga litoralis TaxID=516702 RepID=UPI00211B9B5E|nr:non-ribosomal peptide synthetase [Pigmentiphaga litoralis]
MDPASTAYHLCGALTFTGELNVPALQTCVGAVVSRHDSLRATFEEISGGEIGQTVSESAAFLFECTDLREYSDDEQLMRLQAIVDRATRKPFDLRTGPLLRTVLIRTREDQHQFVVVMHHITSDEWSIQIILDELRAFYDARVTGAIPQLEDPEIRYADYAAWQRRWVQSADCDKQVSWWRDYLRDEQSVLELVPDHPRNADGKYQASTYRFDIAADLIIALSDMTRRRGGTLFVALATALQAVLFRYTGQERFNIGIPVSNRTRDELSRVVGLFVNTVVLRSRLCNRMSLNELWTCTRDSLFDIQARQEVPFEKLVELTDSVRRLDRQPLFQVMFNHLKRKQPAKQSWRGVTVERLLIDEPDAQIELGLQTIESHDGKVEACITFAKELFEPSTIARLASHYLTMLRALSEDPDQAIADVEMLDHSEILHLNSCGQGETTSAAPSAVHKVFEAITLKQPHSVALLLNGESMTYDALNARANRLAHLLIQRGVGPDTLVGIALDRSFDMVVSLLAVLKAGGAYVPLDPKYPKERLAHMIQDSGLNVLISRVNCSFLPDTQAKPQCIAIDDIQLSGCKDSDPVVEGHLEQLAYVIYTSGSTGRPKGVGVSHGCLIRHAKTMSDVFGLSACDRVLQFSTLNFDGCIEQIFPTLISGAALVLRGNDLWDSLTFHRCLLRDQITVVDITTAYWMVLVQDFVRFRVSCHGALRQLHIGGEAMPPEGLKAWLKAGLGHVRLLNTYGPTEATVTASVLDCKPYVDGHIDLPLNMPIGRPLAGRQLLVLDQNLVQTPVGVPGELFIGGELLARGYLGRRALTAERFVADPYGTPGSRLYRSGDLVRWDANLRLEYLGRVDHQVKIRGFRVELGEIEAQLLAFSGVREAIVVVKREPAGARLIGYVSTQADAAVVGDDLRRWLESRLPDYMVPSAILVLRALPLNANGKVDRHALPEVVPEQSEEYEMPLGDMETALADLWGEILRVASVSRNDNFFAMGGNSIAALRLTARIKADMHVELPLRDVFQNSSLRSLALHVAKLHSQPAEMLTGPTTRIGRQSSQPVSPMQHRLWLTERIGRGSASQGPAAYNMALALRLNGALNSDALKMAIEAVVLRHEVLRTVYPEDDSGNPVVVIQAAQPLEVPIDVIPNDAMEATAKVAQLIKQTADLPFDLENGPLLRARLIRLSSKSHLLVLAVHHIAFDGWSESVFFRDLAEYYEALCLDRSVDLPALNVQYADYAVWHRKHLHATLLEAAAFWQKYLSDAPAVSTLKLDFPRRPGVTTQGDAVTVVIPGSTSDAVRKVARTNRTSVFLILLAVFLAQMHRLSEKDDLVVGTDVAGRDQPDLEDLIGFFVNVVPIRSRWMNGANFCQWLEQTQAMFLQALEHAYVPFDQIIGHVKAPRGRGHSPLVQLLFVMQNVPRSNITMTGLEVEVVPAVTRTSKFDLAVFVSDDPKGLQAEWVYSSALYRRETIESLSAAWCEALHRAVAVPNGSMDSLFPSPLKESLMTVPPLSHSAKLDKLKNLVRKDVAAPSKVLASVRTSFLSSGKEFPLVIQPASMDLDAVAWAEGNREFIETSLRKHACLLFRGFGLDTPQDFEAFAEAMQPGLYGGYGDLPKKQGGRNTYRSTPYPERQMILYHNESAHLDRWPRKQWFFCELPSKVGGATPIVDCREMLRRLPAGIVADFEQKGILYVRTFVPRLDVSWQDFFKTESRDEVEARLAGAGIEWRWLDENTLQTRTRCPAVISHPLTGERVFFNQVQLHHVSCLEADVRDDLLALVGAERMTRQAFYGDGSPISDATMHIVGRTYEACAVRFEWLPGDVVMLDNMLAAHARDPYEEPRKIVVAMGDMFDKTMLADFYPSTSSGE